MKRHKVMFVVLAILTLIVPLILFLYLFAFDYFWWLLYTRGFLS
jgi:hypothetical protein